MKYYLIKRASERIKNLSTAISYKTEAKGLDKVETEFYGKFILCSNNEENFIAVEEEEIRYWVRKVPSINDNLEDPDLISKLKSELPGFMYFINNRNIESPKKSRMWFSKNQIYTEALSKLLLGNKSNVYKEIQEILTEDFIKFEVEELKYSLGDLIEKLNANNTRVSSQYVSKILKKDFGCDSVNGSYLKYFLTIIPGKNEYSVESSSYKGRYFTFYKKDFKN